MNKQLLMYQILEHMLLKTTKVLTSYCSLFRRPETIYAGFSETKVRDPNPTQLRRWATNLSWFANQVLLLFTTTIKLYEELSASKTNLQILVQKNLFWEIIPPKRYRQRPFDSTCNFFHVCSTLPVFRPLAQFAEPASDEIGPSRATKTGTSNA